MKSRFFFPLLLLSACASTAVQPDPSGDLLITLRAGLEERRPVIIVTTSNPSSQAICVRAEVLRHPYTYEMELSLRDSRGRMLQYREPGYLVPPLTGVVRLEPGASAQSQYYLDARFTGLRPAEPLPLRLMARVAFTYTYCNNSTSLRAVSDWQLIS